MTTCHECNQPAYHPQLHIIGEPIPYKQNGWIGTTFVPYDRKYKGFKERKVRLCGLCYANMEIENMRERGDDVNELQAELLKLAKDEAGARTPAPSPQESAKTSITRRNGHTNGKRPKMTPEQAVTFDGHSLTSMLLVEAGLQCECMPYADVFTYNRWRAQGMQVQKLSLIHI